MNEIELPEQESAAKSISNMIETGKFPHALLLTGKNGYGTLKLALHITKAILSKNIQKNQTGHLFKKIDHFTHPDLHIFYPINTTKTVKSKPKKNDFISEWREFIKKSLYQDFTDWFQHIGIENKQGIINVQQAKDVVESLKLKPYEADAKVSLIWGAEFMNREAGSKLLKLIEEPPANSYLILMSENKELLLSTILSRCQEIPLLPLSPKFIANHLSDYYQMDNVKAIQIAEQADHSLSKAIHLTNQTDYQVDYEQWFIQWVRFAFLVSQKKAVLQDLMAWSTQLSREQKGSQRNFLMFCQQFFRQAYFQSHHLSDLVLYQPKDKSFSFDKFSQFIHDRNYLLIMTRLEDAIFQLDRNVNTKALLTDLSLQLTKLLHIKNK